VCAAVEIFRDEGWKQVDYNRKAEDYASFLHRVASLAEDEFIQDMHIKELFIFPSKTEFYNHPLYLEGSITLQDKVSKTYFIRNFALFCLFSHITLGLSNIMGGT
jgi:hypothetical protein